MRRTAIGLTMFMIAMQGCGRPERQNTPSSTAPELATALRSTTTAAVDTSGQMTPVATPPPPQSGGRRVVDYAPGLRIDYRVPQVEVECEVILREGDLELFAYGKAPVPKEHETILRTGVHAEKIYEALGLVGSRPGQTLKYLIDSNTIRPAAGDSVDVLVRYEAEGKVRETSACEWMVDVAKKQPMERTHWLFTGSERMENGQFAANYEGTIVTVVDFPSSLLSLPASHSDSDDQLWLKANTSAIPPLGTKVTMLLRPVNQ